MRNRIFFILILLLSFQVAFSQGKKVLTFNVFKETLRKHHPVIQQADIILQNAQQEVRIARAPFDPKLSYQRSQKTYTGLEYYDYQNVGISMPTWLGVDFEAGYQKNAGQYVNDEITLGDSYYVGGSLSLTQGLYMNERRATLQKAKLLRTASKQERRKVLNDLYFDAYQSYFKWLKEYLKYKTYSEIFDLNKNRYVLVTNSWRLGKAPAIDTIEAQSQLQQFELLRNKSFINLREEGIKLSKHIWDSTVYSEIIQSIYIPDSLALSQLDFNEERQTKWLAQATSHPELILNNIKQDIFRINQKQNIQELLPDVGISAYALQSNVNNIISDVNNNNRFGINVSVPLRLSKGRGSYQLNRNKLLGTQLKFDFTKRKIENQILFQLNEINITKSQLTLYDDYLLNIKKLYDAENIKYRLGSSTIFLINSRENKYLDAKIKRLENTIAYQQSILQLYNEIVQVDQL